jgi:MFS family permease
MPDPNPKRLLPLILSITSMGVLTFSLITPTLPDLADALGVSRGSIGLVQGAVAIPGVFLAFFIGYVSDVRGRRFVAVWSLLLFGVAGLSGFFINSFWGLVTIRAIQGIGTSAILSLGVMVIGDLFEPGHERRWAMGINGAGITVTGLFAPILGGYLATGGVFRPFLVFGVAIPLAFWARKLPGHPDGPRPEPPLQHLRGMISELRAGEKLSDFVGLLPFSVVIMIVFIGVGFTATPLYLEQVFDVGSTHRGVIQAALSVGSSAASLTAARLALRFGPAKVITMAFVVIVLGFGAIGVAPGLAVVSLGLLLLGMGVGAAFPLVSDFVTSSVSGTYRGSAVGTWLSSIRLGQAIGPIAGTALIAGVGERSTYVIAGAATVVISLMWVPLRRAARGWVGPAPDAVPLPLIRGGETRT